MRWLAIWLFLTAAWVAGWAVSQAIFGGSGGRWSFLGGFSAETAGHLIAVPLAQVAALWGVSRFRRMFRPHPPDDGRDDRR